MISTTLTVIGQFREQLLQLVWGQLPAFPPGMRFLRNLLKGKTLVSEQESKSARMHYDKKLSTNL